MDSTSSHGSSRGRLDPHAETPRRSGGETRDGSFRHWIQRTSVFVSRRRKLLGLVLGALVVVDLALVSWWPATYRVTARVAVERASFPEGVRPLSGSVPSRLARVIDTAVSDSTLHHLVSSCPRLAEPGILRRALGTSSPTERLRERVNVVTQGSAEHPQLILVSATGESAEEVATLASGVVDRLLSEDRAIRRDEALRAHRAALTGETVDEQKIREIEDAIQKVQAAHPLLATHGDASIRAQVFELEAGALEDEVAHAELVATLPLLASEVTRWEESVRFEADLARRLAAKAQPSEPGPRTVAPARSSDARRAHLDELERELVQARSRWTEQNPDVRRLLREIALERERLGVGEEEDEGGPPPAETREAPAPPPRGPPAPTGGTGNENGSGTSPEKPVEKASEKPAEKPVDPTPPGVGRAPRSVDVQPVADEDERPRAEPRHVLEAHRAWREAVAKQGAARSRLDALAARIQRRNEKLRDLRAVVQDLPAKRLELVRLEGERDRLARGLADVRATRARIERAFEIEMGRAADGSRSEHLALAEAIPARADAPLAPDRLRLFLVGLLLALPIALLVGYVREVGDNSLHSDEDVISALDLPVLGVIPRLRGWR